LFWGREEKEEEEEEEEKAACRPGAEAAALAPRVGGQEAGGAAAGTVTPVAAHTPALGAPGIPGAHCALAPAACATPAGSANGWLGAAEGGGARAGAGSGAVPAPEPPCAVAGGGGALMCPRGNRSGCVRDSFGSLCVSSWSRSVEKPQRMKDRKGEGEKARREHEE
jgi:hypothetical protein